MSASKSLKIGIVVLALVINPGCGRLPVPVPPGESSTGGAPSAGESTAVETEALGEAARADETSPAALTTEVAADLAPRSEARAWLEATSKELEGNRTAQLVVDAAAPVTYINLTLRFDPAQAEIRSMEMSGLFSPGAREVESGPGWKRYSIELTRPIQGQVTLGFLSYVAHGAARTTAEPPFGMVTRFHHESGLPSVEER